MVYCLSVEDIAPKKCSRWNTNTQQYIFYCLKYIYLALSVLKSDFPAGLHHVIPHRALGAFYFFNFKDRPVAESYHLDPMRIAFSFVEISDFLKC